MRAPLADVLLWPCLTYTRGAPTIADMRRVLAAVVVLTFCVSVVVTATRCAGWEATASARMDCCVAMGHDCHAQEEADSCCGRAEQAQRQFEPAGSTYDPTATPIDSVAIPAMPLSWPGQLAAASAFERTFRQRPHSPPIRLSSVLLI